MKVAFQGIKGAYSESAIYKHFGKDAEAIGYDLSEEVFDAVLNNKVDFGLLPFENTIAGSVVVNYDLLLNNDVSLIAEVFFQIKHNLLSHKGSKLDNLKSVYSHPHALEQCREFIKKNKLKAVPEYDTAGAAKIVKERNNVGEAAITSEFCAEIYGLDIIEKDIETNKSNSTKFFVFVKSDKVPKNIKKEKTSISFKTKHYPGALINCLQRLAKHGLNLTKLESRPVPENPWEYIFYADFEGGTNSQKVKLALSEMEAACTLLKVLGSYAKGKGIDANKHL
ncbi:prephenate dehydratase [Candidatus Woesearchaeota archaeon]|jgi:prephenate dehydratase|nr:prephenate dehydratase [Candidatus Woesearchaeota archaeon]|tara:strand:- start:974 stop:1816 length:843 start_codon:yes stop_codon:yes gene_type:complete